MRGWDVRSWPNREFIRAKTWVVRPKRFLTKPFRGDGGVLPSRRSIPYTWFPLPLVGGGANLIRAVSVTRRKIGSISEHAAKKSFDDPFNRAANFGNHFDPRDPQCRFELTGDRTTNHDIHTELPKGRDAAFVSNVVVRSVCDRVVFDVEDTEARGHVKDGRDSTIPDR